MPTKQPVQPTPFENEVRNLIADSLGVDLDEVTPSAHLEDDLGADSLDVVELAILLEEKYELEIEDEDVEKLKTVKDVLSYLESHVKPSHVKPSA